MRNNLPKLALVATIGLALAFTFSCARSSSYVEKQRPPLPDNQNVTVFSLSDIPPVNSQNIGFISAGTSAWAICESYNSAMEQAVKECRKLGGNALKITSVERNPLSGCSQIYGTALYINN